MRIARIIFILLAGALACKQSFGQFTTINTGTTTMLRQLEIQDHAIFICGEDNFLVKCYGSCDNLISLNSPAPADYAIGDLNVIGTNTLFLMASGPAHTLIYSSGDGGKTWKTVFDSFNTYYGTLDMFNADHGVALSTFYQSILTSDGGETWKKGSHPLIATSATEKYGDSTICMGIIESFCISKDRGQTWKCSDFLQSTQRDFFFLNKDTLLTISRNKEDAHFSFSFDEGANWTHVPIDIDPYGLYFKSIKEGYVVGKDADNNSLVMRTTDLGKSWDVQYTGIKNTLLDIKFLNDSIALICGTNGVLLRWSKNSMASISTELTKELCVSTYPNPTRGNQTLTLSLSKAQSISIALYDLSGRQLRHIYSGIARAGDNKFEIDLSTLRRGIYLCKVTKEGRTEAVKVIKQ